MIRKVASTQSTNADLAAHLASGDSVSEGEWLVADRQTAGRGRHGRAWEGIAGNFMGSTVVRLAPGDPPAPTLALVAGLALHEVLAGRLALPRRCLLKWPNDVLVGDAKLAGILLERVGDAVIVGIGANLAAAPALGDRAAVALADFGPAPDRDLFAAELAAGFAAELARWRMAGLDPILARWHAAAHPVGTRLVASSADDAAVEGEYAGLGADGALRLALADGTTIAVHAGEVRLAARA